MSHPYGQAVLLYGTATANTADAHNVITKGPYYGACSLLILPPGATQYTLHSLTSGTDGAWQYYVKKTEPGYTHGAWKYRLEIPGANTGATPDSQFVVNPSFIETTTQAP
jgi:hypothetical protein